MTTTGSYGGQHARLAAALAWLLTHPDTQPTDPELPTVLAYRCAVLDAQRELLDRAIRGADVHRALFGHRHTRSPVHSIAAAPPLALAELVEQVPRHPDRRPALTDALATPVGHAGPLLLAWRDAARHALLAVDTLTSTATGWAANPRRAWRIVADTATTIEALTVLDTRLAHSPAARRLLPGWATIQARQAPALRMVAAHTARLAGSGPLDPATDTLTGTPGLSRPVPLTRLEQLPAGLRAATVLAARTVPTAGELRKIAAAHADLAHTCARLLPRGLTDLAESFTERAAGYRDLAAAAGRVASIHRGPGLVLLQTAGLTRLLQHTGPRADRDQVAGVLADLDTAYPRFTQVLAGRVGHGLRTGAYLVPHPHTLEQRWEHPRPGDPTAARLHHAATRLRVGDRTADQRAADHATGLRRPGRPPALTPRQIHTARQLVQSGDRTRRQVADQLGVGLSTLNRALQATTPGEPAVVDDDPAGPPRSGDPGTRLTPGVLRQARDLTGTGHSLHQVADQLQVSLDRLRAALHDPRDPGPGADPARHALTAALATQPVARRPTTPGHPLPTGRPTPPPARQHP
jgi:hypothetical protein